MYVCMNVFESVATHVYYVTTVVVPRKGYLVAPQNNKQKAIGVDKIQFSATFYDTVDSAQGSAFRWEIVKPELRMVPCVQHTSLCYRN